MFTSTWEQAEAVQLDLLIVTPLLLYNKIQFLFIYPAEFLTLVTTKKKLDKAEEASTNFRLHGYWGTISCSEISIQTRPLPLPGCDECQWSFSEWELDVNCVIEGAISWTEHVTIINLIVQTLWRTSWSCFFGELFLFIGSLFSGDSTGSQCT